MLDINKIRSYFPILHEQVNGKTLVYLDNAATTQKPLSVINAISDYYLHYNANVGRGVYTLAERATAAYEEVREKVRVFLNAKHKSEIVFVPNATFALNLVAQSFGKNVVKTGDSVLISAMEHHSNLVPWQMLCEEKGAHLDVIPITDEGEIDIVAYEKLLTPRTKILALTHVSNVLGTINPVAQMIQMAHAKQIPVLLDGAQAVPHMSVDVQQLDCDFYVFSGHKIYAPTGSGALYVKKEILTKMPPYQGGGSMIKTVSFSKTSYADVPERFEAGTPDIGGVIGLGAALDFMCEVGMASIARHEDKLLHYATSRLKELPQLKIIGEALQKTAVISFVFSDIHPHDIATILDSEGIAVRAGHHCVMPLMERFQVPATTRISFAMYNTKNEVDLLIEGLKKVRQMFVEAA